MNTSARKLGILVASAPDSSNFDHAVALAAEALNQKLDVYFYLIDEAVTPAGRKRATALKRHGAKLFSCAYSLQKRDLKLEGEATFAGLTVLSDIISATDRFVSFP